MTSAVPASGRQGLARVGRLFSPAKMVVLMLVAAFTLLGQAATARAQQLRLPFAVANCADGGCPDAASPREATGRWTWIDVSPAKVARLPAGCFKSPTAMVTEALRMK